jgi:hypothetical protein
VAVGVLLVAFLGVITVYMVGYSDIKEGGTDTAAAIAAQTLVERLRNLPSGPALPAILLGVNGMDTANTAACPGAPASRINNLCLAWAAQVNQLPQGQGVVTVLRVPNPSQPDFFRITITVAWTEPTRGRRLLSVVAGRSN